MSDYLGAPRFRVTEIEGYSDGNGSGNILRTSFSIVDRAYCCAEVWVDYLQHQRGGGRPVWLRRVKARAKCDELNAR